MYFWANENVFLRKWKHICLASARSVWPPALSLASARPHQSGGGGGGEEKEDKRKKDCADFGGGEREFQSRAIKGAHQKVRRMWEKSILNIIFFAEKFSCDKVWRINENEWQQYPIVGQKRFFIQEREDKRWDGSLKSENKVILVQITRTSPRRILSWKVEWGENYVTTWGQRSGQSEVKWLCINHTTLTFPTSNRCCPWAEQE